MLHLQSGGEECANGTYGAKVKDPTRQDRGYCFYLNNNCMVTVTRFKMLQLKVSQVNTLDSTFNYFMNCQDNEYKNFCSSLTDTVMILEITDN